LQQLPLPLRLVITSCTWQMFIFLLTVSLYADNSGPLGCSSGSVVGTTLQEKTSAATSTNGLGFGIFGGTRGMAGATKYGRGGGQAGGDQKNNEEEEMLGLGIVGFSSDGGTGEVAGADKHLDDRQTLVCFCFPFSALLLIKWIRVGK